MKETPGDGMMSTVSLGITPALNIDPAERGMVQIFQPEFSKGESKAI